MEQEIIRVKPSVFAEATYLLDGKPLRLTDRYYMRQIYDSFSEETMIMSGRQVEKSTTNSIHIANHTLLIPNFKALYVAPLTKQVSVFSKERLGRIYKYSQNDIIKNHFKDKNLADNVHHKEFTNGSVNYLEHCFELGDNIRGISTNGIWIDECQDVHIDAIPVIKESQSHAYESGAKIKVTQLTGTPKTFSNTIQQYWDKSTQNEWVVRCPHCGQYQILGLKNMRPDKYVCRKCGGEITRDVVINGSWVAAQPSRTMKGYRISQMMVPWITPSEIWGKYHAYSIGKFYNECLGRSYEDANKPFTTLMLSRLCANAFQLYDRPSGIFTNRQAFMGVDWGSGERSYTVVTIFAFNDEGKLQMLYCHKYEGAEEQELDYQKHDIANLMNVFNIAYCIVDWGYGAEQYEWLSKRFGARIACCYYSFNAGKKAKFDPDKGRWVVNRSRVISDYISYVRDVRVVWAGADKLKYDFLFDHHLVEYAEYRESKSGRTEDLMYGHPEGSPDDGLHSCVYAYLASVLYSGAGNNKITFGVAYGAR